MAVSLTPQEFAAKWRGVNLKERSAAQEHFLDICHMISHPTPAEIDPNGEFFTFERGVEKIDGESGFADVWYRRHFAWEYKKRHASLAKAYQQLLQYRENLENPPLLVVCDTNIFEVHTNFTYTAKQIYRWTNDEISEPKNLAILRNLFYNPETLRPQKTLAQVTEEAARDFARLAPLLTVRGVDSHQAAHFLIRILFCLFAEDISLLPEQLFTRIVKNSLTQPQSFTERMQSLFKAMATGGVFGADNLPYFNGGLFSDDDVVVLEQTELQILLDATKHDWASVEPAIFGTLFERSLDPSKRSQLGAHYTSKEDILRIVEPVVMAPLRARWNEVRVSAEELRSHWNAVLARYKGRGDAAASKARNDAEAALRTMLTHFLDELGNIKVLDPACGSGNFLYVTLALLMELQNEVRTWAADNRVGSLLPVVNPQQLYGFEVNTYARELAQVVIWIGYLQWMFTHYGSFDDRPILKTMETIAERDAVLDCSNPANVGEPSWPDVYAIVGNPPFIGGKRMRKELGDSYVDSLFTVYNGSVPHEADFVCYWFEKAREQLANNKAQRVGLVATNSIRGGANRKVLKRIKDSGDIFMAWSDEPWTLEGAAVRISLIGFDTGREVARMLNGRSVAAIYPDLTSDVDLTQAQPLSENMNIAFMGDTKGGPFDITSEVAIHMLSAPLNPNGRPNSEVVRLWVNGSDITRRSRDMFIIDFGADMTLEEAALFELPFNYVEEKVKGKRASSKTTRKEWWLHERPRPELRKALEPLQRYICTPRVAKHRVFIWLSIDTIPDSATIAIARDDDYIFGVLHSRPHELWSLRKGTNLGVGNDPRYTPSTTFEMFPFPCPDEVQREVIAFAARDLDAKRNAWLNPTDADAAELAYRTLTNLYNKRPAWLRLAHERLDAAVFAAYEWDREMSDEELLAHLLELNLKRATAARDVGLF